MKEHKIFIPYLSESFNDFIKRPKGSRIDKNGNKTFFNAQTDEKNRIKNQSKRLFKDLEKIENPIEIEWIPIISKYKNHKTKKRAYDVLNYVHQYKYTEDQLEKLKIIVNDNSKYVKKHILNTPLDLPEFGKNGIIIIIRELTESSIEEMEKQKMEIFECIKDQSLESDEELSDQDFAINFFKDRI